METTGKEPKKESEMMAAAIGKRELQPRAMLIIFAAAMLLMLYSVIRYTNKFDAHPPATRERLIRLPVQLRQMHILDPLKNFEFKLEHKPV